MDHDALQTLTEGQPFALINASLARAQQRVLPGGDWRERLRDAAQGALRRAGQPWPSGGTAAPPSPPYDDELDVALALL